VAATLASVLAAEGLRVGLYTSPHLVHFRERFQVSGRPLGDETLAARAEEVRHAVVQSGLTFFEAATVLGFHAFAEEGVEVAVVEVGLGGRLDATNVLTPACSVITNVAMDHAEYLGPTVESVATEKAGIIKGGVPVLTAESDPGLLELFRSTARQRNAPFTALDPVSDLHHVVVAREGTAFTLETRSWGALRLSTPLVGRHQAINAALAVEALEHLPERLRPDATAVVRGVAEVRWPGRDQIEQSGGVTWLLDVAHNTAGVLSLVDVLDRLDFPSPVIALVGVLGDKDWRAMLPPLFRRVQTGILTQPPSAPEDRRWDPEEALRVVSGSEPTVCTLVTEVDFARAFARAGREALGGTVVVTGSVHTVGSALRLLGRDPFPLG
jgi:dihydrofolate synthase/folylpolyglutamate synthase